MRLGSNKAQTAIFTPINSFSKSIGNSLVFFLSSTSNTNIFIRKYSQYTLSLASLTIYYFKLYLNLIPHTNGVKLIFSFLLIPRPAIVICSPQNLIAKRITCILLAINVVDKLNRLGLRTKYSPVISKHHSEYLIPRADVLAVCFHCGETVKKSLLRYVLC